MFNFSLPKKARQYLISFMRPAICDIWGRENGQQVLENCSIHQLIDLLLWAFHEETNSNTSVGANVIGALKAAAEESTRNKCYERINILLRFGIPRLLELFEKVISLREFHKLTDQETKISYCTDIIHIMQILSDSIVSARDGSLCRNPGAA